MAEKSWFVITMRTALNTQFYFLDAFKSCDSIKLQHFSIKCHVMKKKKKKYLFCA